MEESKQARLGSEQGARLEVDSSLRSSVVFFSVVTYYRFSVTLLSALDTMTTQRIPLWRALSTFSSLINRLLPAFVYPQWSGGIVWVTRLNY